MGSIRSLPSSPFAASFTFHRRLIASRGHGCGALGLAGIARPAFSAGRISIAASSPPLFRRVSDAKGKDALFREDTLREAAEAVSQRFQRECSVADVQRRLTTLREKWQKIENMKALGSASCDYATRTINMREADYKQYATDHPKDSGMLNRPIEDYDELSFIFSDDSSADRIQLKKGQNAHPDNSKISEDPVKQKIANEDIRYLVLKVGELIDAIKSLKPRDFAEDLWKAVTACGYNDRMLITAFEYFLKNEVEGKIFLVRSPDLRKEWLAKFFSSLL